MTQVGFIESVPLSNRVPDAIAPRDSINLPKNAVSDRVSGGNGGLAHIADTKFVKQTCIK
ncbi:hypothetical protein [uncultured Helicobacter sp.]|uniref:hypothetical protein n=1 Tax=uncultured Helicobacter sp. TaxID=175537 RepID=UPI00375344D4